VKKGSKSGGILIVGPKAVGGKILVTSKHHLLQADCNDPKEKSVSGTDVLLQNLVPKRRGTEERKKGRPGKLKKLQNRKNF